MIENTMLKKVGIEGLVRLELKDALTGRVKERIEGKNHVFKDVLFSQNMTNMLNSAWLMMTPSTDPVDVNFPFIKGQCLGYGVPSNGSTGAYRGAYTAAQVLNKCYADKGQWIYSYDFTGSQANGTIGTVGITHQFSGAGPAWYPYNYYTPPAVWNNSIYYGTGDGRYVYIIGSSNGIITKYDLWLGTTSTIDVSAIVGTVGSNYKTVGYSPETGKYYIFVSSNSVAAQRMMYEFTDNTFATLSKTYNCTNVAFAGAGSSWPLYIYGNFMYSPQGQYIYYEDFVNNSATVNNYNINTYNYAGYAQNSAPVMNSGSYCTMAWNGKYVLIWGNNANYQGIVFDLSTNSIAAWTVLPTRYYPACLLPSAENALPCVAFTNLCHSSALTTYVLPTPLTKTSANALNVTYTINVNWK